MRDTFETRRRVTRVTKTRVQVMTHDAASIIFPNAIPPSRIDINFVEHTVAGPNFRARSDFLRATRSAPGNEANNCAL